MEKIEKSEIFELKGFTKRFALVDDQKIHYVVGGNGPAIMLLHGWSYTLYEWKNIMPGLKDAGYTVIVPDLTGCGESSIPDHIYTKFEVAKLLDQLTNQLGFLEIYLMGIDIGIMVAYAFAANYSKKNKESYFG